MAGGGGWGCHQPPATLPGWGHGAACLPALSVIRELFRADPSDLQVRAVTCWYPLVFLHYIGIYSINSSKIIGNYPQGLLCNMALDYHVYSPSTLLATCNNMNSAILSLRVDRWLKKTGVDRWSGRLLGIITSSDLSVCKSNRLHPPVFIDEIGVYSTDSSKMIGNFPAVLNFNRLFLKLNQFIRN